MTNKSNTQDVWGAVLGLVISALLAIWTATSSSAGARAGEALGLGSPEIAAAHAQAAQPGPQPVERNKAIVELEKKIAGQENKPAEEVFKNIQVFKGQPAIRVLRVMEMGFAPALGVKCVFCHIPAQWDKDDKKHKVVARKMMTMTMNLNKEVREITDEKAAVNCYTCHRGQEKPALSPQPAKPAAPEHEHKE